MSISRPSKTPLRKEVCGYSSSRIMEQSMIERHSDYSRELQMISETNCQEGYSTHLHTIMSETKQDYEDFEPHVRDIV
jgi:hypothetical protein